MKAVCYYGKEDIRVERVPDPKILNPRDAIIKITATAICGSDLHIYDGFIPTMQKGDVLGHEFMGEVVEVGRGNNRLRVGDRVVVPFTISSIVLKRGDGLCDGRGIRWELTHTNSPFTPASCCIAARAPRLSRGAARAVLRRCSARRRRRAGDRRRGPGPQSARRARGRSCCRVPHPGEPSTN